MVQPTMPSGVSSFEHPPVEIYLYGDATTTAAATTMASTIIVNSDVAGTRIGTDYEREDDPRQFVEDRIQLLCENTTLSVSKGDQSTNFTAETNYDELVSPLISTNLKSAKHFTFDKVSMAPSIELQQDESRDVLEEHANDEQQQQQQQQCGDMRVTKQMSQPNNDEIDKIFDEGSNIIEGTQHETESNSTDLISEIEEEEDDEEQIPQQLKSASTKEEIEVPFDTSRFVQDARFDVFDDNATEIPPSLNVEIDHDATAAADSTDKFDDSIPDDETTIPAGGNGNVAKEQEEQTINSSQMPNDIANDNRNDTSTTKQLDIATSPSNNINYRLRLLQKRSERRFGNASPNKLSNATASNNINYTMPVGSEDGIEVDTPSFSEQLQIEEQQHAQQQEHIKKTSDNEEDVQSATTTTIPKDVTVTTDERIILVEGQQQQESLTASILKSSLVVEATSETTLDELVKRMNSSSITNGALVHVDSKPVSAPESSSHLTIPDSIDAVTATFNIIPNDQDGKELITNSTIEKVCTMQETTTIQSAPHRPITQYHDSALFDASTSGNSGAMSGRGGGNKDKYSFYQANTINIKNEEEEPDTNNSTSDGHIVSFGQEAAITKKFEGAIVGLEQLLNSVSCTAKTPDQPSNVATTNNSLHELIKEVGLTIPTEENYQQTKETTTMGFPEEGTKTPTTYIESITIRDNNDINSTKAGDASPVKVKKLNTKKYCGTEGIDIELKTTTATSTDEVLSFEDLLYDSCLLMAEITAADECGTYCVALDQYGEKDIETYQEERMDRYSEDDVETCQEERTLSDTTVTVKDVGVHKSSSGQQIDIDENVTDKSTDSADADADAETRSHRTQRKDTDFNESHEVTTDDVNLLDNSSNAECISNIIVLSVDSNSSSGRSEEGDSHDKYEVALLVDTVAEYMSISQHHVDDGIDTSEHSEGNSTTASDDNSGQHRNELDAIDNLAATLMAEVERHLNGLSKSNSQCTKADEDEDHDHDGKEESNISDFTSNYVSEQRLELAVLAEANESSKSKTQCSNTYDNEIEVKSNESDRTSDFGFVQELEKALFAELDGFSESNTQCSKTDADTANDEKNNVDTENDIQNDDNENNDEEESIGSDASDYGSIQRLERALLAELDEQIQSLSTVPSNHGPTAVDGENEQPIESPLVETNNMDLSTETPNESPQKETNFNAECTSELSDDLRNSKLIPMIADVVVVASDAETSFEPGVGASKQQQLQPPPIVDSRDEVADTTALDETVRVGDSGKKNTRKSVGSVLRNISQRTQFGICPTIDATKYYYVDDVPFDEIPMEPQSLLLSCAHKDAFVDVNAPIAVPISIQQQQPKEQEQLFLQSKSSTTAMDTAVLGSKGGEDNVIRSTCSWSRKSFRSNRIGHSLNVQCFSSSTILFFAPRILSRTTKTPRLYCNGANNRCSPRHHNMNIGTDARVLRSTDDDDDDYTTYDYEEQYILDLSLDDTNIPSDEVEDVLIFSPVSSYNPEDENKSLLRAPFCHILTFWD